MTHTAITSGNGGTENATGRQMDHIKGLLDPCLRGLEKDAAQAIIKAGGKYQQFFATMTAEFVARETNTYEVEVDYTLTANEKVDAGHYGNVSQSDILRGCIEGVFPDIPRVTWMMHDWTTSRLSKLGKVRTTIKLIEVDSELDEDGVRTEIYVRGFRAANATELLALGAARPYLQEKYTIVALGTVWQETVTYAEGAGETRRSMLALDSWRGERRLDTVFYEHGTWRSIYRDRSARLYAVVPNDV